MDSRPSIVSVEEAARLSIENLKRWEQDRYDTITRIIRNQINCSIAQGKFEIVIYKSDLYKYFAGTTRREINETLDLVLYYEVFEQGYSIKHILKWCLFPAIRIRWPLNQ